MHTSIRGKNQW